MMRKTIKSVKKAEVLNKQVKSAKPEKTKPEVKAPFKALTFGFPVGTKFILNGKLNLVRKAFFNDNTEMRLVYSDGNEEIVMLSTLRSEADFDNEFAVIEE